MERLTYEKSRSVWDRGKYPTKYTSRHTFQQVVSRLAAYEDTGLEPEDIDALQKREQGLAELLVNISCGCAVSYTRLAELAQAEKDGRLSIEPPNDPLTLEELREMDLFEWLWIEVIHPTERQVFRKIESAYYQVFEDYTAGEALCCGWPGLIHEFEYMDYGKTWLAYRRKPEEGTMWQQ